VCAGCSRTTSILSFTRSPSTSKVAIAPRFGTRLRYSVNAVREWSRRVSFTCHVAFTAIAFAPSQAPRRSAWLLKNIHFLRIRILRTDAPRRSRRRGASHHGGLWARRIHMREAQRRSPPRIIRITDRRASCPVSQFIPKPMASKINTKAMPMRMKV
jgi:hypothetical protein